MGDRDRDGSGEDDVEAVDFGPHLNDWLRMSTIPLVRIEMRREAALVVMAEGDDDTRNT